MIALPQAAFFLFLEAAAGGTIALSWVHLRNEVGRGFTLFTGTCFLILGALAIWLRGAFPPTAALTLNPDARLWFAVERWVTIAFVLLLAVYLAALVVRGREPQRGRGDPIQRDGAGPRPVAASQLRPGGVSSGPRPTEPGPPRAEPGSPEPRSQRQADLGSPAPPPGPTQPAADLGATDTRPPAMGHPDVDPGATEARASEAWQRDADRGGAELRPLNRARPPAQLDPATSTSATTWRPLAVLGPLVPLLALCSLWSASLVDASGQLFGLGAPLAVLAGGLALGSALAGLSLGHWYLVSPTLSVQPLIRLTFVCLGSIVLQLVLVPALVFGPGVSPDAARSLLTEYQLFLGVRIVFGLLVPIGASVMAWRTARIRSLDSATGLLYIVAALVLAGEIAARTLYFLTGVAT